MCNKKINTIEHTDCRKKPAVVDLKKLSKIRNLNTGDPSFNQLISPTFSRNNISYKQQFVYRINALYRFKRTTFTYS